MLVSTRCAAVLDSSPTTPKPSMVSTRSRERQQQHTNGHTPQTQQQTARRIPSAVEQEQQLQADRAMLDVYRKQWQSSKGFSHSVFRHFRDVCWWLEHVCGINMLDYEEKVVVSFILLAVLILLVLGAYKQSTRLVFLLKQMLFPSSH